MTCQCDLYTGGMLKTPITVNRVTNESDGAGGYTSAWGALAGAPTRAYVKAKSGAERYASERVEANSKWTVVMRYFSGLRESDTITIRDRVHNIRFINNLELEDRWLVVDVDGGVAY